MLELMAVLVAGLVLLGTAALVDQPYLFVAAAAVAAGLVLFLTRGSGLLARRAARHR
jgi:hypothetical protein